MRDCYTLNDLRSLCILSPHVKLFDFLYHGYVRVSIPNISFSTVVEAKRKEAHTCIS